MRFKVVLLCLFSFVAFAEEAYDIRILFGDGYPPYYGSGANGGVYNALLEEFSREHPQFRLSRQVVSRKRLDTMVAQNKAQVFSLGSPMFVVREYADKVRFTQPIWCTHDKLLSLRSESVDFTHLDDLKGLSIGTIYGSGYGPLEPYFERGDIFEVQSYDNTALIDLLRSRKIDAMVVNADGTPGELIRLGLDASQYYLSAQTLYGIPLASMVTTEAPQFYDAFNGFVQRVHVNGWLENQNRTFGLTPAHSGKNGCVAQ